MGKSVYAIWREGGGIRPGSINILWWKHIHFFLQIYLKEGVNRTSFSKRIIGNTSMICDTSKPSEKDMNQAIYIYHTQSASAANPTFPGSYKTCIYMSEGPVGNSKECIFHCDCNPTGCDTIFVSLMNPELELCAVEDV